MSGMVGSKPMAWFALARVLFVAAVAYAAALLHPLPFGIFVNIDIGAGRLRKVSHTCRWRCVGLTCCPVDDKDKPVIEFARCGEPACHRGV